MVLMNWWLMDTVPLTNAAEDDACSTAEGKEPNECHPGDGSSRILGFKDDIIHQIFKNVWAEFTGEHLYITQKTFKTLEKMIHITADPLLMLLRVLHRGESTVVLTPGCSDSFFDGGRSL